MRIIIIILGSLFFGTTLLACDSQSSNTEAPEASLASNRASDEITSPLLISRVGAFHVGGELVEVHEANVDASETGTVFANQLMVRYYLPATNSPKSPVVMMPGDGLASDIYLETPDGREGWAMQFIQVGHPVYLVEPANSTRAGINPEILNAHIRGRKSEPAQLFTWAQELTWTRFGFGPAEGEFLQMEECQKTILISWLKCLHQLKLKMLMNQRLLPMV